MGWEVYFLGGGKRDIVSPISRKNRMADRQACAYFNYVCVFDRGSEWTTPFVGRPCCIFRDVVVLMGREEITSSIGPDAGKPMVRRFTDMWQRNPEGS